MSLLPDYIAFTMDSDTPAEKESPRTPYDQKALDTSQVDLIDLLKRIKHDVLVNRVRVNSRLNLLYEILLYQVIYCN